MYIYFLSIFLMFTITACATKFDQNNQVYCSINKNDDLKYLNYFNINLLELKIPKNLDIIFPEPFLDYYIPPINLLITITNGQQDFYEMYKKPNICPPIIILKNLEHESCLLNSD